MDKNPLTILNIKDARRLTMVILLIFPVITGSFSTSVFLSTENVHAKKYERTQVISETNLCGNDFAPFSILCENLGSETQGNGNALNTIGSQMSHSMTRPLTHSTAVECGPVINLSESPVDTVLGPPLNQPLGFDGIPMQIAASGKNVYTVWVSTTEAGMDVQETLFRKSNDWGVTFDEIKDLSNNGFSGDVTLNTPQVAASGDNVYVVWASGPTDGSEPSDIWLSRSTDGGNSFEPKVNLGAGAEPQILALGDNVYVAWGWGSGAGEAYLAFRVSTDRGANFEPLQNLWPDCPVFNGNCTGMDFSIKLAAFGNIVAVVWLNALIQTSQEVLITVSSDMGESFSSIKTLSETGDQPPPDPVVAAFKNNIYTIWNDHDGLTFTRSTDGGANFEPSKLLSEAPPTIFDFDMAVSGKILNIVWSQNSNDDARRDIFLLRSTDSGTTFEPVKILSSNTDINNNAPKIAAHRNIVYVTWSSSNNFDDDDLASSVLLTRSIDGGATFGPVKNVSGDIPPLNRPMAPSTSSLLRSPEIASSGKYAYVVWPGGVTPPLTNDVFFTRCM